MKILLDECLPLRLRNHIPGHDVFTVEYMGWKGIGNGRLMALAAAEGFDLVLTMDRGQLHSLPSPLPVAIVVLRAKHNSLKALRPLVTKLLAMIPMIQPRSFLELK